MNAAGSSSSPREWACCERRNSKYCGIGFGSHVHVGVHVGVHVYVHVHVVSLSNLRVAKDDVLSLTQLPFLRFCPATRWGPLLSTFQFQFPSFHLFPFVRDTFISLPNSNCSHQRILARTSYDYNNFQFFIRESLKEFSLKS